MQEKALALSAVTGKRPFAALTGPDLAPPVKAR